MGSLKENYLEGQEDRYFQIADALGLTCEELLELDYSFDANVSKDGLIYNYILRLSGGNDSELVAKIKNLRSDNSVILAPWVFEKSTAQDYEFEAIFEGKNYKDTFYQEMEGLKKLLALPIADVSVRDVMLRQVFITIIGALETFLCDVFVYEVMSCKRNLRRFVETYPDFKKIKLNLNEIFAEHDLMEQKVKEVILGTVYHQLPRVKNMYEDTLQITFPEIATMQRFITQRHDLVHRNGRTALGDKVPLNDQAIYDLQRAAIFLVEGVSSQLEDIPF